MGNFYKGPQDWFCGRSLQQIVAAMFFIYDIYTDFEYLATVPIVNNVMLGCMIATLVLPFVLSCALAIFSEGIGGGTDGCSWYLWKIWGSICVYTGTM